MTSEQFETSGPNAPNAVVDTSPQVLPDWIVEHENMGAIDRLVGERRLRDALLAQPVIRTEKHVQLIDRFLLKVWPTARRIGDARVSQVSRAARHREASKGDTVVKEGERGMTFFILVSGRADVFKKTHSSTVPIATLDTGASFGEASLGPGAPPRNATVVCASEKAEFLVLHKDDYDAIMRKFQKQEHKRAFKCMRGIALFRHWSRSRVDRLCDLLQWHYFAPDTVIVRQGDAPDNVYFILEGVCVVTKDVYVKKQNTWPTGVKSWTVKHVRDPARGSDRGRGGAAAATWLYSVDASRRRPG